MDEVGVEGLREEDKYDQFLAVRLVITLTPLVPREGKLLLLISELDYEHLSA
jgi:hypothetical protein